MRRGFTVPSELIPCQLSTMISPCRFCGCKEDRDECAKKCMHLERFVAAMEGRDPIDHTRREAEIEALIEGSPIKGAVQPPRYRFICKWCKKEAWSAKSYTRTCKSQECINKGKNENRRRQRERRRLAKEAR